VIALSKVDMTLEHHPDDRHPDRIVLKPANGGSNSKTWVTISGNDFYSFQPSLQNLQKNCLSLFRL